MFHFKLDEQKKKKELFSISINKGSEQNLPLEVLIQEVSEFLSCAFISLEFEETSLKAVSS